MPALIEIVSVIGAAPNVVFDLELDVDVHAASLHGSQETATTSTGRRRLALGDEVTFRARHFGLRWRMTSRITVYEGAGPWRRRKTPPLWWTDGVGQAVPSHLRLRRT